MSNNTDIRTYDFPTGEILAFDKPLTWTSFNLVKCVRNQLCRRLGMKKLKVGHAGTLDPLATGVLIICTGRATKQIDVLQAGTKEYIATLRLGQTTPSFDAEHDVDGNYPTEHITRSMVEETLKHFLGSIMQVPPVFSACKVEGRRAFDLAREGSEVELKAKELVIDEIELLDCHLPQQGDVSLLAEDVNRNVRAGVSIKPEGRRKQSLEQARSAQAALETPTIESSADALMNNQEDETATPPSSDSSIPYITIRVVCSKGTYIRALARDIGQALHSGAYLISLRRTRIGDIRIEDCMKVEDWPEFVANVPLAETTTED